VYKEEEEEEEEEATTECQGRGRTRKLLQAGRRAREREGVCRLSAHEYALNNSTRQVPSARVTKRDLIT